jgi:hypothetical protein
MSNPRKALITVLVGQGEEKLLIPFPVDKTANELIREVQRRLGGEIDPGLVSCVRVRSIDGPRVFGEDQLEDLIGESSVFYVGPAQPIAISPKAGQALSPSNRTSTPMSTTTMATTAASPLASLLSPPMLTGSGDETPPPHHSHSTPELPPPPELPPTGTEESSESLLFKYQSKKEDANLVLGKLKYTPLRGAAPRDEEKPEPPEEPEKETRRNSGDGSEWYFNPPAREKGDAPRPRTRRGDGACSKGDDMGGDVALAKPPSVPGAFVERISDRRVDWVLTGVQAKLQEYPKGTRMFSPEFSAYGFDHLGLVLYPNGNSNAKLGFCSLGLKAPHGAHLRYKLIVAGTEKFTELRQNVTESWGFVDMCRVEDAVEREKDQLRLGVEIIDDIDKHEELVQAGSTKIEWTLHNMANKLAYYHKDVALYSEEFSASGVDKLRMKLYLHGKCEADDGWCSLYLEAPKGSELRCRLSVGKKGMSFDRLEKFGEDSIWGFLTLCQIADEVEGDTLRVGLQVLETKRLDANLTETEDQYLKTLPSERRAYLLDELQRVEKIRNQADAGGVPSRFRILMMQLPDSAKAVALQRLESLSTDLMGAEATKLKRWVDGVLALPFGKLERPVVSLGEGQEAVRKYLARAVKMLDESVYGHEEPKERITQVLCQWISNPDSMSLVLGIQGPPGNGKTTLCRKGSAEALVRPFSQLSLGGATDASVLEGHSYTYVGSSWGRIAGLLMETQCMNPVVFFDELDKVSETPRGDEINGVLTHLTDHSQNNQFTDRYFDGIPIDLSKAMFIFSFNDESKIHPVLRDRLTIVKTKGFNREQKQNIAQDYLLPDLLKNVGMEPNDIRIADGKQGIADVSYLLDKWGVKNEPQLSGVRPLKQALEAVVLHVNKLRVLQGYGQPAKADAAGEKKEPEANGKATSDSVGKATGHTDTPSADKKAVEEAPTEQSNLLGGSNPLKITLPLLLTRELIDKLLPDRDGEKAPAYMYI